MFQLDSYYNGDRLNFKSKNRKTSNKSIESMPPADYSKINASPVFLNYQFEEDPILSGMEDLHFGSADKRTDFKKKVFSVRKKFRLLGEEDFSMY